MVVGHLFLVFLFYPFLESSYLGAPGLAFCQAGGSRLFRWFCGAVSFCMVGGGL